MITMSAMFAMFAMSAMSAMSAMFGVCFMSAVVVGVVAARTAAGVVIRVVVLVVISEGRWCAGGGATRLGRWGWVVVVGHRGHLVSGWCGMWVGRCAAGGCC